MERKCYYYYRRIRHNPKQSIHRRHDRLVDPPADGRDKRYNALDYDGIGLPGSAIFGGDILVNKQVPAGPTDNVTAPGGDQNTPYKPSPLSYKSPATGYIDRVLLTSGETNSTLIKILMRQTRRPELGDKFSSRHGQKGVCGLIVNQEDMPFNDQGICPGKLYLLWSCCPQLTTTHE